MPLAMASRLGASLELLKSEFTRGIDGSGDLTRQLRGSFAGSVAGALGKKQEFVMQERDGALDGVGNAVGNTVTELRNGKFLSAIYTLLAEIFPDGLVRDAMQGHTIKALPHGA